MTITNYQDLHEWFKSQQRADKPAAHWNLYGLSYGQKEVRTAFNFTIDNPDESYDYLQSTIKRLNNPDGSVFRIQLFSDGKANHVISEVRVQVYQNAVAATPAAIGSLPGGIGDIQGYINTQVQLARLQWENEDLKAQLNAPSSGFEKIMLTLAEVPGIDEVLKVAVAGLVTKMNPASAPAVAAAMNGTPPGGPGADEGGDPENIFIQNIQQASARLGTDPLTLAKKLNHLVQSNPDLALSVFSK